MLWLRARWAWVWASGVICVARDYAGNVALIAVLSLRRTAREQIDNPSSFNFVDLILRKAGNLEDRPYLNRAVAARRNLFRDFDSLVEILCVYQK